MSETANLAVSGMDQTDHSGEPQTDPHWAAGVSRPRHPFRGSFWLRELPYIVVLALTLFGVAYASFSRQPMVGYWEFLAPVIGLPCIIIGWPHAHDRSTRVRLIWTQALHWLAFLVAMNMLLLSGVSSLLSTEAVGLTILTLLALGTFVAGVHVQAWQICILGMIMAVGVPAIAWIERSALLLLIALAVLAVVAAALWWSSRKRQT
ncbi:MAG TPA: hypothetical protein VKW08_08425 [Xanthobacteraceae bacterium]|nr:hypothetical protein [Xanthobacteraceae bacterium]